MLEDTNSLDASQLLYIWNVVFCKLFLKLAVNVLAYKSVCVSQEVSVTA